MAIPQSIESVGSSFDTPDLWAELDSPCTIIAGEVVERNIQRMADYCRQHGIALRPHTKTHKSQRIAQLQIDAGAVGLTVAKPGETVVMSELAAEVLIAYPSVTRASLDAVRTGLECGEHDRRARFRRGRRASR